MGLHRIKKLLLSKETISKMKRQPVEWEEIFSHYSSHKVLITRIYEELKKLNTERTNNPMNKWANELNSSQKEVQITINTQEIFNILSHKGTAIQNDIDTLSHYSQNSDHQKKKKKNRNKWWPGCREKQNPYILLVGM
jgi:hypothetical protein